MPFTWMGCLDGSSVDLNKVDAFTVGNVQKHDSSGQPMFSEVEEGKKEPTLQMCTFAVIGQHSFPIKVVADMREAQHIIQSILGSLKTAYDKERGIIQVATHDEKNALKLG